MRLNASFVKIIGKSNPFWLNDEPKLRGDSQLPSLLHSSAPQSDPIISRQNVVWALKIVNKVQKLPVFYHFCTKQFAPNCYRELPF